MSEIIFLNYNYMQDFFLLFVLVVFPVAMTILLRFYFEFKFNLSEALIWIYFAY